MGLGDPLEGRHTIRASVTGAHVYGGRHLRQRADNLQHRDLCPFEELISSHPLQSRILLSSLLQPLNFSGHQSEEGFAPKVKTLV